jgi:ribonuclease P protein component
MKRANRVRKHQEFDSIIHESRYVKSPRFVVYYRLRKEGESRIGISVSKRNGNSVTRNRIKRQIRAVIAAGYKLNQPLDIIIVVRASYLPANFADEREELLKSLGQIGEKKLESQNEN